MIVATRPEPTVRPPSRFNKYIFRRVFGAFYAIFHGNNMFITHYLFITLISWHRFGTGILFRQTVSPIEIWGQVAATIACPVRCFNFHCYDDKRICPKTSLRPLKSAGHRIPPSAIAWMFRLPTGQIQPYRWAGSWNKPRRTSQRSVPTFPVCCFPAGGW